MQIEVIVSKLDSDKDHVIRFDEWNRFYEDIWSKTDKKQKLLSTKPVFEKKSSILIPSFVIKVTQLSSEDLKHPFRYPVGHEFYISEEKIRNKPGIYQPDIYFHQKILSINNNKQFQIGLQNTLNTHGFFLKNLTASNPTSLKVRKFLMFSEVK